MLYHYKTLSREKSFFFYLLSFSSFTEVVGCCRLRSLLCPSSLSYSANPSSPVAFWSSYFLRLRCSKARQSSRALFFYPSASHPLHHPVRDTCPRENEALRPFCNYRNTICSITPPRALVSSVVKKASLPSIDAHNPSLVNTHSFPMERIFT